MLVGSNLFLQFNKLSEAFNFVCLKMSSGKSGWKQYLSIWFFIL